MVRTYYIDGEPYISVTSIISLMFPFNSEGFDRWCRLNGISATWIEEESKRIGTMVSEAVENAFYGMQFLNETPTSDVDKTYLSGVDRFLSDFEIVESEKVVFSRSHRYAGTLDAIVRHKGQIMYVDFKTYGAWRGEYKRSNDKLKKAGVQISMYQYANEGSVDVYPQAVVVFTPDGKYIVEEREFDDSFIYWIEDNKDKLLI